MKKTEMKKLRETVEAEFATERHQRVKFFKKIRNKLDVLFREQVIFSKNETAKLGGDIARGREADFERINAGMQKTYVEIRALRDDLNRLHDVMSLGILYLLIVSISILIIISGVVLLGRVAW